MADGKPELYWLSDPEIHRKELLDLTPEDAPNREQFVDNLISSLYCTRIRPDNAQVLKTRTKGNSLVRKARAELEELFKANIKASRAIQEYVRATRDPKDVSRTFSAFGENAVQIGLALSRIKQDLETLSRGVPKDGRSKGLESHITEMTLALWKAWFPEDPLPARAMQGRKAGGHEPAKPVQMCALVLEFMTGSQPKDISRLYEKAVERLDGIEQSPGTITLPL